MFIDQSRAVARFRPQLPGPQKPAFHQIPVQVGTWGHLTGMLASGVTDSGPSFVSARFDLKNSLFFRGVILSNGPQVDPGYHGALFCMLYNGSDSHVGITRGHQFSTIEFHRTCGLSRGYSDKYQKKYKLSDFIPSDVAVSNGGMILERSQEQMTTLRREWDSFRKSILWAIPILVAVGLFLVPFATSQYEESVQGVEDKRKELENKIESIESLETQLNLLMKINGINVNKIQSSEGKNRNTIQMSDSQVQNFE
ncbi:hypothetical protein [Marinobacter shengliensis]|uniref:hypothetical protein n=1 Tax=Marinobacter shengliensis TaxID=1389223 RepID=UPI001E2B979D|nr:hypothetical protein [Marinobacter shengliensis]MCD1629805.1 hypothetical protein [Marinobacter shengliensis]